MSKYKVPLKITFDGYAIVEAKDELDAEMIVGYNIKAMLGHVSDNNNDKIVDWDFESHGYAELRDDESTEDCDENDL